MSSGKIVAFVSPNQQHCQCTYAIMNKHAAPEDGLVFMRSVDLCRWPSGLHWHILDRHSPRTAPAPLWPHRLKCRRSGFLTPSRHHQQRPSWHHRRGRKPCGAFHIRRAPPSDAQGDAREPAAASDRPAESVVRRAAGPCGGAQERAQRRGCRRRGRAGGGQWSEGGGCVAAGAAARGRVDAYDARCGCPISALVCLLDLTTPIAHGLLHKDTPCLLCLFLSMRNHTLLLLVQTVFCDCGSPHEIASPRF